MSLTKKHFDLLGYLNNKDSLKKIRAITNESERIIRYRIDTLNDELKEDFQINIENKKIYWNGSLEHNLDTQFKKFKKLSYSYSQDERITLIIIKTLILDHSFLLDNLCYDLDISKPTLRSDLKKLKIKLLKFNITLEQKNSSLYYYNYNVSDFRFFVISLLYDYFNFEKEVDGLPLKRNTFFNSIIADLITPIFKKDFFEYRKRCTQLKKSLSTSFSGEALNMFILFISLDRDKNINLTQNVNFYKNTEEYLIFSKIFPEIEVNYKILFTDCLLGISYRTTNTFIKYKDWLNIEIEVYNIVSEFSKQSCINLHKDKLIVKDIVKHIKPMVYRLNKKICLENTIYNEIHLQYAHTLKITKQCFKSLEKLLEINITNEELSFLALRFQLALDRLALNPIQKVAIVCNFGLLTSKFLKERLKEVFNLKSITLFSLDDFLNLETYSFELVVTTVNITNSQFSGSIVKVHPLLSKEDIDQLTKENLSNKKKKINFKNFLTILNKYATVHNESKLKTELISSFPDNFLQLHNNLSIKDNLIEKRLVTSSDVTSIKEAIKISGKLLESCDYISSNYTKNLISSTKNSNLNIFIGNNTIFPHTSNNNNVFNTKFTFLKLKSSILFKGRLVKFIVCFCSDSHKDYLDTLFKLMELFGEEEEESKIINLPINKTYEYLSSKLYEEG